ncbi:thiol-disulfide oxidoreductase DCC family protein [Coraliomargarita sp. W4R53]
MNHSSHAILFYDGDCGLCNRSVQFLLRRDTQKILYFAPIQGETARQCLPSALREMLSTAIYQRPRLNGDVEILLRSEAVLCTLIDIHSRWRWLATLARWVPYRWRDAIYNWVARNRHRSWSKNACGLPTSAERARFLP